jgi:predicted O-methyltransferase YrrM
MTPLEIKSETETLLAKPFNTRVLLNMARLINENDRRASSYTDPYYIPFYYHLGKLITPKSVVEVGLRLGLTGAVFLTSCKSVEEYLALHELNGSDYYSGRLAKANIRDHYRGVLYTHAGSVEDPEFSTRLEARTWDLAVVNDQFDYDRHLLMLETLWPLISPGGYLVCDYIGSHPPARKAWDGFCAARRIKPEFIDTRYGVSIAQQD